MRRALAGLTALPLFACTAPPGPVSGLMVDCMSRVPRKRRLAGARAERLSGEFVAIKGGDFQMSGFASDESADEKPVERIHVDDFKLARYEVTQWLWRQVMGRDPWCASHQCGDDWPVAGLSFNDIVVFIAKLNAQTGKHYRLPTAVEWEYACRSGGKPQRYCGGDELITDGWSSEILHDDQIHPVGSGQPNALGLYDMSGNVWEWTCSAAGQTECVGDADARREVRGGSEGRHTHIGWPPGSPDHVVYVAWCDPDLRGRGFGLRLAQDP